VELKVLEGVRMFCFRRDGRHYTGFSLVGRR
jgi:hypothetical protein